MNRHCQGAPSKAVRARVGAAKRTVQTDDFSHDGSLRVGIGYLNAGSGPVVDVRARSGWSEERGASAVCCSL